MDGESGGGKKRECVENGGAENSGGEAEENGVAEVGAGKITGQDENGWFRSRNLRLGSRFRPLHEKPWRRWKAGMEESWKTAAWTKNWGEPDQFSLFFKGVC